MRGHRRVIVALLLLLALAGAGVSGAAFAATFTTRARWPGPREW